MALEVTQCLGSVSAKASSPLTAVGSPAAASVVSKYRRG